MRLGRAELLRAVALVALPAATPPQQARADMSSKFIQPGDVQAEDKSWGFALPAGWEIDPKSKWRSEPEHLFHVRAAKPGSSARLEVLVDLTEANGPKKMKNMKDLGSLETVAEKWLAFQPQPATLAKATKVPPPAFAASPYELRYSVGEKSQSRIVKLVLQQGRLTQLIVVLDADASAAQVQEVNAIVDSFKAFPLNIGCLSQSNRGGDIMPGVCY